MATIDVKTADGSVLDWMVAKAVGLHITNDFPFVFLQTNPADYRTVKHELRGYKPTTNRALGWEILDQIPGLQLKIWLESKPESRFEVQIHNLQGDWIAFGPSALIAGCRCFVESKLGPQVDVPDGVLKHFSGERQEEAVTEPIASPAPRG